MEVGVVVVGGEVGWRGSGGGGGRLELLPWRGCGVEQRVRRLGGGRPVEVEEMEWECPWR